MIDPVTLEVIRNTLPAIANEMAADLQRTSYNMMIYEVCDFCTALTDAQGRLISQNVGGVSHFVADLGVGNRDPLERRLPLQSSQCRNTNCSITGSDEFDRRQLLDFLQCLNSLVCNLAQVVTYQDDRLFRF